MGTSLIIKGADFSANGIAVPVDITNRFTFTSGAYKEGGASVSSSAFIKSDEVDVEAYVGRTMQVAWCAYKSSSGTRVSYRGLFFYDEENNEISSVRIPLAGSSVSNGQGYEVDENLVVPVGAKYFKTTYLAQESMPSPVSFFCRIL